MCLGPKGPGSADGVDSSLAPPCGFVTGSVHLAMMAAAQRDDEFVAHFSPKRTMLRKPKVMRIRRLTPTNQAGLLSHEFAVGLVPKPTNSLTRLRAPPTGVNLRGRSGPHQSPQEAPQPRVELAWGSATAHFRQPEISLWWCL